MELGVSENSDTALAAYQRARRRHWDKVAAAFRRLPGLGGSYHRRLTQVYRFLVPAGQRVLELGCGQGDLLAALKPEIGVGVDFSGQMLKQARERHPHLRFVEGDVHDFQLNETFDFVILSDLVNDLWDVQRVLENVVKSTHARTRILINTYSRLWELPLALARRLRLARPSLRQNWLTVDDLKNLLSLSGFETMRQWQEILCPFPIPGINIVCNRFLAKTWPVNYLGLTNFLIARPAVEARDRRDKPTVSVIVPARNEAGNVAGALTRTPEMGGGTELIFVEGHSTDNTCATIEKAIADHPQRRCRLLIQNGKGKGDAVRLGFENASGDIVMILDADLTVPPEDLPRFYEALVSGKGEFINGVRLVYPMEVRAMRPFNFLGNKFFSLAFSWLLGQAVKDTLCGTKVLWKRDYELIARNRAYFGDFDPFGDFDLLFGATKLNLKITDLPVRYRERTYGTTNIRRWRHGLLLLKMVVFAATRIKFV